MRVAIEHRFSVHLKVLFIWIFSYSSVLTYVLGAQKNCLIETVLLSIHDICFGLEIKKKMFGTHSKLKSCLDL